MIEFTIKTLDSNNHPFSVEDETTVQQLKEKVRETMGIEINLQRLIFCGRVLQDDKKLAEYGVEGKVIHLVQRAPPSPESRQTAHAHAPAASANGDANHGAQHQIRRLMTMAGPPGFLVDDGVSSMSSPTVARLEFIQRLVNEIKESLEELRNRAGPSGAAGAAAASNGSPEPDSDSSTNDSQEESESLMEEVVEGPADESSQEAMDARRGYSLNATGDPRGNEAYRPNRSVARYMRPRELADLMEELDRLHTQFAPYRANYIRLLRACSNPHVPTYTDEERQREQRTVDTVAELIHSFAHAYHAVSDLNFQVGQVHNRLTSESQLMRHAFPMQGHINVMQSNRRPQSNATVPNGGAGAATSNQANAPAGAAATFTPAAAAAGTAATGTAGGSNDQGIAGRTPVQPTVNVNVQPDPVTYQVEIETRMPIAFALENGFLEGLAQAASSQAGEQAAAAPAAPAQANGSPQTGAPPPPPPPPPGAQTQAGQSAAQAQNTRRQVLIDLENLFRGLGQASALGGVEVVMSMEEIPPGASVGGSGPAPGAPGAGAGSGAGSVPGAGTGAAAGGGGPASAPLADGGVFVGAMPWGGAPGADLLQNIVSSVIRQGLVPGMEGVAVHLPGAQSAQSAQPAQPGQGNDPQSQNGQVPTQNGQAQGQNGQPQDQNGQAPRQPHWHLRRATTTTRAQAVPFPTFMYDRFLACDSVHARQRVARRRNSSIQQMIDRERARADRVAAQRIEILSERNANITEEHMQTLLRLLHSAPSRETWLNALLVTIARQLHLSDMTRPYQGDPPLVPRDFPALRQLLRNYFERVFREVDGDNNSFRAVADYFVELNAPFIRRMSSITPIRMDVDVQASLLWLTRCRLPAIFASVMSDAASDIVSSRFYQVFTRLFTDVCALISYCCVNGNEGLRTLFRTYVEEMVQDLSDPVRQLLSTLFHENLNAALTNIAPAESILPYVRRLPTPAIPMPSAPMQHDSDSDSSPMDMSPSTPEPPQSTPPATPSAPLAVPTASATHSFTTALTVEDAIGAAAACPVHASTSTARANLLSTLAATASSLRRSAAVASAPTSPSVEMTEEMQKSRSADDVKMMPVLMQNWERRWVPVLQQDGEAQAQAQGEQEPFSDAYLAGMPARKRRRIRQQRPTPLLGPFIQDSMRDAAEQLGAEATPPPLRSALRDHMRHLGRSRVARSAEHDARRHRSTDRFLLMAQYANLESESDSDAK